jgi:type IV pilus assembly protein PilC
MADFKYSAVNAEGFELTGQVFAPDLETAKEQLRRRGLLPGSISETKSASQRGPAFLKRVEPTSLQIFSRQFATLIEAGVSIVSALLILEEQTNDKVLGPTIADVRANVESGTLLSRAMAQHPRIFSRLYVAMVEAGEASGTLDRILDRIASQIEKETKIKRKVKGAMTYPIVVLSFAVIVLTALLLFIVPIFVGIFTQLHGKLPALTQYVFDASDLMKEAWFVIFPVLGLSIWGLLRWKRTESGRKIWDSFRLKLPMKIGDVVLKVTMARFSRTLSTLVGAGVDIVRALEITGATSGNWVVEKALAEVRTRVEEGVPIHQPLVENPIFPAMVSQMIKIGEETGELENMLSKIADFYEDEVDTAIAALTSIIEPIMMIAVGGIVGLIVIAMYLPMFKLYTVVANQANQ